MQRQYEVYVHHDAGGHVGVTPIERRTRYKIDIDSTRRCGYRVRDIGRPTAIYNDNAELYLRYGGHIGGSPIERQTRYEINIDSTRRCGYLVRDIGRPTAICNDNTKCMYIMTPAAT
jgi:hypothetical protein